MVQIRINSRNIDIAKFKCVTYFTCYLKEITLVLVIFITKTGAGIMSQAPCYHPLSGFTSPEREFSRGYPDTEISSARVRSESEGITFDAHKHWTDMILLYMNIKMCILSLFIFAHDISNIFNVTRKDVYQYIIGIYLKQKLFEINLCLWQ